MFHEFSEYDKFMINNISQALIFQCFTDIPDFS